MENHMTKNAPSYIAKRKTRGLTLLELLGAIAVGVVVSAGVIYYVSKGRDDAKTRNEADALVSTFNDVRNNLSSGGFYATAGSSFNQSVINRGMVPSIWKSAGTTVTNHFGGGVTWTANAAGFTETSTNYTQKQCSLLLQNLANGSQNTADMTVSANGGAAYNFSSGAPGADTACSLTTGNSVTLTSTT